MEGRARADGCPETAPLPPRLRVIDAAVQPLGVEPHRVGDTKDDPLPVLEYEQPLGLIASVDRHVCTEPERVELVDPGVVAPFSTSRASDVAELREWLCVEAPSLWAMLTGGGGAVKLTAAFAPVEARHVPAPQGSPVHAVPIDVTAARGEAFDRLAVPHRELEDLGERRLRRIRARRQPDDGAGEPKQRSPY